LTRRLMGDITPKQVVGAAAALVGFPALAFPSEGSLPVMGDASLGFYGVIFLILGTGIYSMVRFRHVVRSPTSIFRHFVVFLAIYVAAWGMVRLGHGGPPTSKSLPAPASISVAANTSINLIADLERDRDALMAERDALRADVIPGADF